MLAELDGSIKADVRDEPREARVAKIVQLLVVLKYPPLKSAHDDDREAVERGLAVGEKSAIYPILHWLLDRLPQHKKRAYVARFLYPVDVPQEFMQDEVLAECYALHYLNCLTSMAEATLKRIDDEEGWKAGKGRGLLPNFKCYEDLYTNKLAQQQAFSDQLRKQRATIEKHEGPNMKQRAVYADLEKLLAFKLKIVEDDTAGQMGFASTEYDLGNARVAQFSTL